MVSRFKGFSRLAGLNYETNILQCEKDCGNSCEIVRINTPDGEFYYGDICERYSGAHERGKAKSSLFNEREKLMMSYHGGHKPGQEKIGIARVGTFNEFAPFWFTMFDKLDYETVVSRKTDKAVMKRGVESASAEQFCFPIKVAFGHYRNLIEMLQNNQIDYLFVPDVIETPATRFNKGVTQWERSYTCPYIQNFNSLMMLDDPRIISSYLFFDESNLVKLLYNSFRGKRSRRDIRGAVESGFKSYYEFKSNLRDLGKRFLEELEQSDKQAIVLVGRPYATFDEAMNLRIVRKITDSGFRVLPQDMLPLPEIDLSGKWNNEFSIQGQAILQAANVIKKNPNLEAVFLDYFACGPNSFIRGFFQEELGKPFLTIQIDEHSADAGVSTRLQAFLDSLGVRK